MNPLEQAWQWYIKSKEQYSLLRRIAHSYWTTLPWDGPIGRDDRFKHIDERQLIVDLDFNLDGLEDLAILVLFAAFEALVRVALADDVKVAGASLEHPVLIEAVQEVLQRIETGSFYRVLEPFKSIGDEAKDLIEQVNQVRRYRNWVAHGKRGQTPNSVTPEMAMDRLTRFHNLLTLSRPQAFDTADPDAL